MYPVCGRARVVAPPAVTPNTVGQPRIEHAVEPRFVNLTSADHVPAATPLVTITTSIAAAPHAGTGVGETTGAIVGDGDPADALLFGDGRPDIDGAVATPARALVTAQPPSNEAATAVPAIANRHR
jgi:hypothetical protein